MARSAFAQTLCTGFTLSFIWPALGSCAAEGPDDRGSQDVQALRDAAEGSTAWTLQLSQGTLLKALKDQPYPATSEHYDTTDLCFLPIELGEIPLQQMVYIGDTQQGHAKIVAKTGFALPALFIQKTEAQTDSTSLGEQSLRDDDQEDAEDVPLPQTETATEAGEEEAGEEEAGTGLSESENDPPGKDSWIAAFDQNLAENELYRALKRQGITFANERSECPFQSGWVYEGHVTGAVKEPGLLRPFDYTPINSCYSALPRHLAFAAGRSGGRRSHAACDVHGNVGDRVVAIADGTILNAYDFYAGTCAVEVAHKGNGWEFVARYGELKCQQRAEIAINKSVLKGDLIGEVGNLIGISASMLHFELYSAERTGPLTTVGGGSPREYFKLPQSNPGKFFRRRDLLNPTSLLRDWRQP